MDPSVRLRVKVGGALAAHLGKSETEVVLGETATLREIAERAGVSPSLVMLYSVNGTLRPPDYCPADGDELLLVPAVSGG